MFFLAEHIHASDRFKGDDPLRAKCGIGWPRLQCIAPVVCHYSVLKVEGPCEVYKLARTRDRHRYVKRNLLVCLDLCSLRSDALLRDAQAAETKHNEK